jgi:lysophospholipase L1-like esterase
MQTPVPLGLLAALLLGACHSEPPPVAREAASGSAARPLEPPAPAAPPSAPVLLYLESDAAALEAPAAPTASDSAPSLAPPRRPCRVAALGDSLTDYRSGGGGYLRWLEQRCPESEFVNYGKGGDMVNQMRRRFEAEIAAAPPGRFTHLIVFGGVNDLYSDETAGRSNAKIQRDLAAIYERAHARGLRVVAITVAPWGGFSRWYTPRRGAATDELNAWIKAGPADAVVDAHALLSCGDRERLCAEYAAPFKDGLHFGKKGQELLGEALYRAEFERCL